METVSAGTQVAVLMARLTGLGEWEMGHVRAAVQSGGFEGKHAKGGWEQAKKYPAPGGVCGVVGLDLRAYLAGICSST
ncbi:hypothetical protein KBAD11_33830 [Aeromonas dhakensis]|nr:hypothetical protein KBAD45_33190 [Aeromonas dhakensis]CAD7504082.1 hypothetical protein KBAD50_09330 [Aeromonas dhakensis]CAD7504358.1 hypothetical protein KBAD49_09330 [Aeromonas dhakensis]CAD7526099.1 hypothetical protein KBAD59_33880 [Aeromonas dhakensis]CAD7526992.1 hypothetical protein KBAD11_33830 [Aeromonas dhakensis]